MYKIYLRDEDGKNKKPFSVPFFSTKHYRRALEVMEQINNDKVTINDIEILSAFIVEVFRNQFTEDELQAGVSKLELTEIAGTMFSMILYDMTEEQVKEAKNKALQVGKEEKEKTANLG